ncbi:unnamed protein product [Prorocentrum cordatum]|uniref:Glycosyl transferase 48 domain-containing protein n=1 Tax=Prorocentrum cordatum TaxID=2364126 RepID=A0ABN9XP13_9DINO|nr:unnamed protein product [Polarella glacialis]
MHRLEAKLDVRGRGRCCDCCDRGVSNLKRRFREKVLWYLPESEESEPSGIWNDIKGFMVRDHKIDKEEPIPPLPSGRCSVVCCGAKSHLPTNADAQWRVMALARGLRLPMPRPYRAPYIPGITVLVPHFKEDIYTQTKGDEHRQDLSKWLQYRYKDEFGFYGGDAGYQNTNAYRDWMAFRQQTLFRTIEGMCLYQEAIRKHFELQGIRDCRIAQNPELWSKDVFTCLVTMQLYGYSQEARQYDLRHIHELLLKHGSCLKVAYIHYESKGAGCPKPGRRYYSCLIDNSCLNGQDMKSPKFKVELPGYPILGDGKGDNQNHAIPFTRGHYLQTIDANQGAYFEQLMLLPCALGEFRRKSKADRDAGKKILGFPEHLTSDIGSVGDFAASAEMAFGTILQRAYVVMGGRMHYGHPDIMNRLYMMQQGGVSKATKTLNLSEDIFAGMDFTLRGHGRQIKHCEYMAVVKGRDMGFRAVLQFFSKLASGTGEQLLTRQTFRLEQVLELPEALCFYYAHGGYYLIQFVISWSMPLTIFVWLLVLVSGCEEGDVCERSSFGHDALLESTGVRSTQEAIVPMLSVMCSPVVIFFLLVSSLPWFAEMSMQRGACFALGKLLKSYLTLSPLLFVFQSKCIGHYIVNEFRYGGATYVATGRGLPTERMPFMRVGTNGEGKPRKYEGLYKDYAVIAHHDGAMLLVGLILVWLAGGNPGASLALVSIFFCSGLVIVSWLWAPYVFNPYQFKLEDTKEDWQVLKKFFRADGGIEWLEWYWTERVKTGQRLFNVIWDIGFVMFAISIAGWYMAITVKVSMLNSLFSDRLEFMYVLALIPPVVLSFACCTVATVVHLCRACVKPPATSEAQTSLLSKWPKPEYITEPAMVSSGFLSDVPLHVLSVGVVSSTCLESFFSLIHLAGWWRALLAGVVLKLTLLSAMTLIGEGTLRSPFCRKWPPVLLIALEAWVCAHRMAKDALTSLIIMPVLFLFAKLDGLNRSCNPSGRYNLHHWFLYRAPGNDLDRLRSRPLPQ